MNQTNPSFAEDLEIEKLLHEAKQGKAKYQYKLGMRYAEGNGVTKDPVEACAWLRLAAIQGKNEAVDAVKDLNISSDEVNKAKERSKSLLEEDIGISELVQKVRSELEDVQQDLNESGKTAMFHATQLELELHFGVRRTKTFSGGLSFLVFDIGAEESKSTEQVHKIKLSFCVNKAGAEKTT